MTEWGVFTDSGEPVLVADSVYGVEYMHAYLISKYPQEQGAFESYNKVQEPFQAKLTFLLGNGGTEARGEFLAEMESRLASLDLVTVATPEISYPSANFVRAGYRREVRRGVTLMMIDVWIEEVRIATQQPPPGSLDNTQSPNGQSTQQGGTVQAEGQPTITVQFPNAQVIK